MLSNLSYSEIPYVLVALLLALGFHEAMHAFVAHRLGDDTASEQGRITLNPLKHVDILTTVLLPLGMMLLHLPPILIAKPVPFDPNQVRYGEYGGALVALAGPFTNLALAAFTAVLYRLGLIPLGIIDHFAGYFLILNVSLFIFNMLPIPPLDGSRLLYAFAPEPLQRIMAQIEAMGFAFLIVILLLLSRFISPILDTLYNAIIGFLL